jgi:hypothetical protein
VGSDADRSSARRPERDTPVVRWRRQRLIDAGFSARSSDKLARDLRVDLHGLLDLVQSGCPPEFAVRILAPLDPALDAGDSARAPGLRQGPG